MANRGVHFALTNSQTQTVLNEYGELSEDDFQYTWEWFQAVRHLYKKASTEDKVVIFNVDC